MKRILKTDRLPQPFAPYSFGMITDGPWLFVSGQGPYNPETRRFERGSIREQMILTLRNVESVLRVGGAVWSDVIAMRIYLQPLDRHNFDIMNSVYLEILGKDLLPVRTTIGATLLDIDVEIDCIATCPKTGVSR